MSSGLPPHSQNTISYRVHAGPHQQMVEMVQEIKAAGTEHIVK